MIIRTLAFVVLLFSFAPVFAGSYVEFQSGPRPSPEPALPPTFDPFVPPVTLAAPAAGAPAIAEWTKIAQPDGVVALTGSQFSSYTGAQAGTDTQFEVFGQSLRGHYLGNASVQVLDGLKAAVVLPEALPADAEYLLWPVNSNGSGAPVAVNATEAWWIGPNTATRSDTVSIYGRNLARNAIAGDGLPTAAMQSYVYIQQNGATGLWAKVTAANPYKVDFTVPASLADGDYQVWIHNGRGGHYGWSGPLTLTVNDGMPWTAQKFNVKAFGAKGNGVADDEAAIEAAVQAAAAVPWSTVYLPAGTYMVSSGFNPPSKVRWLGDGANRTFIKANSGFVKSAGYDARRYCLIFSSGGINNIEFQDLTLDANGNMNGALATPIYLRFESDVRFVGVTINAKGYDTADFHGTTRLLLQDSNIIGGGNGVFFGSATQVRIENCAVYGTDDVNTMLTYWGGNDISCTNTTAQDYNNKQADGWAQGRFFYGSSQWGSNRNIYVGNCTTRALAVRPALPNQNTGEQFLWENSTKYSGVPVAVTPTTITFAADNFFTDPGLTNGSYDAVIVNGPGLGQHRKIVGSAGTTITLSSPWNVPPDSTSTVIIAGVVSRCALYHNSIQGKTTYATQVTASAGIQPYGNSFDFIADSNTISQTRNGIYMWGMNETSLSPQSVNCVYFNYIAHNTIEHCLSGIVGVSQAWNGWPSSDPYPGISFLGNTFAANAVNTMAVGGMEETAATAPIGDQIDLNVFDHDHVLNSPTGINLQPDARIKNSISYKNDLQIRSAVLPTTPTGRDRKTAKSKQPPPKSPATSKPLRNAGSASEISNPYSSKR